MDATEPHAPPVKSERADPRSGTPGAAVPQKPGEVGGPKGPEPTRFGDWEVGGRCTDF